VNPYGLSARLCELTPIIPADADRVYEYCQDPEIQRWTEVPVPYRLEDAARFTVDTCAKGWDNPMTSVRVWGIRVPDESGRPVLAGSVGLKPDGPSSVEIGYLIAPEFRGQGICTAAVQVVVAHALEPEPDGLGMRRVLWQAMVGNWPSRVLAVRCGFTVEGTIRSHCISRGEGVDIWIGTLLASDLESMPDLWEQHNLVRPWL